MNTETTEQVTAKVYEKKECPHCKAMVSSRPGPWAIHQKKCPAVVKKADEKKTEVAQMSYKPDLSMVSDKEVLKTLEEAYKVQEAMLKAPEAVTADMTEDVNYKLRRRYAPETIEGFDANGRPLHTHTAYFGDANEMKIDIARGYVPKINEGGAYVRNMGGDILYTRPLSISQSIIRSFEKESEARVAGVTRQAQSVSSVKGMDAPGTRDGEIRQEEFGVAATLTVKDGEI